MKEKRENSELRENILRGGSEIEKRIKFFGPLLIVFLEKMGIFENLPKNNWLGAECRNNIEIFTRIIPEYGRAFELASKIIEISKEDTKTITEPRKEKIQTIEKLVSEIEEDKNIGNNLYGLHDFGA